jgi:hypothetical protein
MRFAAALAVLASGCASGTNPLDPEGIDAGPTDAAAHDDAAEDDTDAAANPDAAPADAVPADAASPDAASPDAAAPVDAGVDAMVPDGGPIGQVDTCAQAYDLTGQAGGNGVTVNGTTMGYANDISMSIACTGYTTLGPDAIYRVDLAAGQTLHATADPTTNWDVSLFVVTPCTATPACLVGDDNGFAGTTETVMYTATAATTAYIVVDGYNTTILGPYALTVRVQQ